MKIKVLLLIMLLLPLVGSAQKKVEKPKVHADFYFGSLPASRAAAELMAKEKARLVVVGYHAGWSVEKIAKELKLPEEEIMKMSEDVEDQKLGGERNEYEVRPFMPVIRDRDIERLRPELQRHTREFADLVQSTLPEIEKFVGSLPGAEGETKDRLMYETVVSGILLGGIVDTLTEDKTIMPPGRRRVRDERFYAWLVESDPALAGKLKREVRESDGYQIVTIGSDFSKTRPGVSELRSSKGDILDEPVARRYRAFVSLLSRDTFLPFFKARRNEFLKQGAIPESAKYVAFADFFAWYYNVMVDGVVDQLIASGKIKSPTGQYTYAVRLPGV